MSVIRMFAVQDVKAGVFHPPFVAATEGVALRHLTSVVSSGSDHVYARFPEDFTVYEIGEYDEVTGTPVACSPRAICSLVSLRQTQS